MTGRNFPSPDDALHLLHEADIDDDPALVQALQNIALLADGPAPDVSAELAQLMADGGKAKGARRTKGRITFIGGALAVSMGVGVSGVAAGTAHLQDGPDPSGDQGTRLSARQYVEKIMPGYVAGPATAAPRSSDAAAPAQTSEPAPPASPASPAQSEGWSDAPSDVAGTESGNGLPPVQPAAHPGATPAPPSIVGVAVPTPAPYVAPSAVAPAPTAPAPSPSTGGMAAPRSATPAPVRVLGGSADAPRFVRSPVTFGTLGWVDEGPDEVTAGAMPDVVWLRAPGAAPQNVVFLSAPMSADGQWLALFLPEVTDLTWDPVTGEYVPGEIAPDALPEQPEQPELPEEPGETIPVPESAPGSAPSADSRSSLPVDSPPVPESAHDAIPSPEATPESLPDGVTGPEGSAPSSELRPGASDDLLPAPAMSGDGSVEGRTAENAPEPTADTTAETIDETVPGEEGPDAHAVDQDGDPVPTSESSSAPGDAPAGVVPAPGSDTPAG